MREYSLITLPELKNPHSSAVMCHRVIRDDVGTCTCHSSSSINTKMSATLPDTYRAVNKTDVIEIRRHPESGFDPEPTTLCKVLVITN